MPQPVKLSDPLVDAARAAAQDAERSLAGQIEHWARLGRAVESTLSVDAAIRLKRGAWPKLEVREPPPPATAAELAWSMRAAVGSAGAVEPLPPRLRPGVRSHAPAGFPAWLERQRGPIATLCRAFGVRHLAFFGSVLREDFDPLAGSDIDATVEFRDATGLPTARQFFDFKAALEQRLRTTVDLVELDAMPETRLKRIIARTRRPFHVEAA